MVERAGLENQYSYKAIRGSNPLASAWFGIPPSPPVGILGEEEKGIPADFLSNVFVLTYKITLKANLYSLAKQNIASEYPLYISTKDYLVHW